MKKWLWLMLAVLAAVAVTAQVAQEPYPGQSQHAEPPAGWQCQNQNYELSVPPDHVCSCERMRKEDGTMVEDQQCKVYCHMDHCACAMTDLTQPHEPIR